MLEINIDKTTSELAACIVEAIQDKKGTGITVLDLSQTDGASTHAFVIATGKTPTQVRAISESVEEKVRKETGDKPVNIHGYKNSQWIIMDYGSIMVHVFVPDMREYYNLEGLWSDAPEFPIPDQY